jgi:hypothetical protein
MYDSVVPAHKHIPKPASSTLSFMDAARQFAGHQCRHKALKYPLQIDDAIHSHTDPDKASQEHIWH